MMVDSDYAIADDSTRQPYDQILIDIVLYVFNYEITTVKAFERAKIALLDALGCCFETLKESADARLLIGPVVPGTHVPNGFKLPGTTHQLDPVKGAFDLGSMIRYLDHNDAFPGAEWGHPSDNIGAILSIADHLSRFSRVSGSPSLTMRAVLVALVKAYEIQGCFQTRNAFNKVGLDHTILVRIASTTVVCYLLECTEEQTLAALSHAFIDAGPLRIYRQSPNAGPRKGWAGGDACMRAVQLAYLVKQGQPGAPSVLTDTKWGLYTTLMKGQEFLVPKHYGTSVIENVFFKIHAAEGHAASAVEAALILAEQLRERNPPLNMPIEEAISYVRVRTQKPAMIIINKQGPLHNPADRDHCMQYMVSVVLLKGHMITSADYQDSSPWATDPRVDTLRAKIHMVEDEQMTADYHDPQQRKGANALQIRLANGEDLGEALIEYPTGHPWRDDTPVLVKQKFERNVESHFHDHKLRMIMGFADKNLEQFMKIEVCDFVDAMAHASEEEAGHSVQDDSGDSPCGRVDDVVDSKRANGKMDVVSADKVRDLIAIYADLGSQTFQSLNRKISTASGNVQVEIKADDDQSGLRESPSSVQRERPFNGPSEPMMQSAQVRASTRMPVAVSTSTANPETHESCSSFAASNTSHTANETLAGVGSTRKTTIESEPHPAWKHNDPRQSGDPETTEVCFEAFPPGKSPHASPYISYNSSYAQTCAGHIDRTFHARRVYILASDTLSRETSDLPRLHSAIDDRLGEDTVIGIRRGIKPHTHYSEILQIVGEVVDKNIDCVVTLGGGSLIDAAKVLVLALANHATSLAELESLYFDSPTLRDPLLPATIPIICIPTTLSASEFTPIAGATNDVTKHKHSFQHISMGPRLIILSPELTMTTPMSIWLSTGIRAVDHCIESICSIKPSPEGDAVAEKGLRRLLPGLLTSKAHPGVLSSRLACQLGAMDAISAPLNRIPMGASHGIGHQLGPLGVGHGETSCVLLPAVCKYNRRVNGDQQHRALEILWSEAAVGSLLSQAGLVKGRADLGDVLDVFFRTLGMPRSLEDVHVTREKFEALAVGSLNDRWCKTNPVPLKEKEQILDILEMCAHDSPKANKEQTFKQYSSSQAKAYTAGRQLNRQKLYDVIIQHHASTSGTFEVLLDIGCGPGNSTFPMAKHFKMAYGSDPSEEMIQTAEHDRVDIDRADTLASHKIDFSVGKAEDLVPLVGGAENKVDLLTAGAAAHWFDMARFWVSASKVVKPGGTVALYTLAGALIVHPSTHNASLVQEIITRLERTYLSPYDTPNNALSRAHYDNLLLPWAVSPPVTNFPESGFTKISHDRDGKISSGHDFFLGNQHMNLDQFEKLYSTASLMTRWRRANPEMVGTEDDILVKTMRALSDALEGEVMVVGTGCAALLFKKR